jgi:hypothetical protein
LLRGKGVEQLGDAVADCVERALGGLAQEVLELGEELLDGVEVRRILRQEEEPGVGGADRVAKRLPLVAAEVSRMTMSPGRNVGTRTSST